jgi:hypothetical protein
MVEGCTTSASTVGGMNEEAFSASTSKNTRVLPVFFSVMLMHLSHRLRAEAVD